MQLNIWNSLLYQCIIHSVSGTSNNILLRITYQIVVELTAIIFFAVPHNLLWIVSVICRVVIIFPHCYEALFLPFFRPCLLVSFLSGLCYHLPVDYTTSCLLFPCALQLATAVDIFVLPWWGSFLFDLQLLLVLRVFPNADFPRVAKSTEAPALALPACRGHRNCLWHSPHPIT